MKWRWLIVLVPAGLGGLIAWLLTNGQTANPILYLRADLGTLVLLGGLGLSAFLGAGWFIWQQLQRAHRQDVARAQTSASEDRRRFIQRLDHELKNPLTVIRAALANFADTANAEALTGVEAQTMRLSSLTSDLRKLAELETRPLEFFPTDVAELLREVVALAEDQAGAEARRLTLTLPKAPWPLPPAMADRDLIFLAVFNLINNALKFTRPGDTVEVRAFEDGATVVVEVADTGPGIPEEELAYVWEELYRGEGARGVPGSGLGLALVRAIVARHHGQAVLRSRIGRGTVITLRLPMR